MKIEQFKERVFRQSEATGEKKVPVEDEGTTIYGSNIDNQIWIDVGSPGVIVKSLKPAWLRPTNNGNNK